jgi:two-component sensor histidine kinase
MVVAELVTNAVRHAFDQQGGTIRVECRTSGAFVECRVSDNGSASNTDIRPGSGLRIIEALAQAFGATFQFDFGMDGSKSVLTVPIEQGRCDEPKLVHRAANSIAHIA